MHTLILALPHAAPLAPLASDGWTLPMWQAPMAAGHSIAHTPRATGTDIQAAVRSAAAVIVTAPMSRLAWHVVTLPAGLKWDARRADPRLDGIVANQLEDRLASDVARVHVTLDARLDAMPEHAAAEHAQGNGLVSAVVCEAAWLDAWLAQLAYLGIEASRVVPHVPPQWLAERSTESEATAAICSGTAQAAWVSFLHAPHEGEFEGNFAENSDKSSQNPANAPKPLLRPTSPKVDLGPGAASAPDRAQSSAPSSSPLALPLSLPLVAQTAAVLPAFLPSQTLAMAALPAAWDLASHSFAAHDIALIDEQQWVAALLSTTWDLTPASQRRGRDRLQRRLRSAWTALLHEPRWAAFRAGVLAAAAVLCVGANVLWFMLAQDVDERRAAATQLTRHILGATTPIIDAPVQIARARAAAHLAAGVPHPAQAAVMLDAAARALGQVATESLSVGQVQFEATSVAAAALTLQVAAAPEVVATLAQRLPALLPDYAVTLQNPEAGGATIRIVHPEKPVVLPAR